MPTSPVLAILNDPDGRQVVLDGEGWQHILTEHREMSRHQAAVRETIEHPSSRRADPLPGRERYYRHGVGPSRWVMVVVDLNQTPARIVTAFGLRRAHI